MAHSYHPTALDEHGGSAEVRQKYAFCQGVTVFFATIVSLPVALAACITGTIVAIANPVDGTGATDPSIGLGLSTVMFGLVFGVSALVFGGFACCGSGSCLSFRRHPALVHVRNLRAYTCVLAAFGFALVIALLVLGRSSAGSLGTCTECDSCDSLGYSVSEGGKCSKTGNPISSSSDDVCICYTPNAGIDGNHNSCGCLLSQAARTSSTSGTSECPDTYGTSSCVLYADSVFFSVAPVAAAIVAGSTFVVLMHCWFYHRAVGVVRSLPDGHDPSGGTAIHAETLGSSVEMGTNFAVPAYPISPPPASSPPPYPVAQPAVATPMYPSAYVATPSDDPPAYSTV